MTQFQSFLQDCRNQLEPHGIDFIKSLSVPGGLTFSKSGCKSLS